MRKKKPRLSSLRRERLKIIDAYVQKTGDQFPALLDVAKWALKHREVDVPQLDLERYVAKQLASAAGKDFIADENGSPVHHRLFYKEKRGDTQLTFCFKMEDATPEKMKLSVQSRRRCVLGEVLQLDRDINYYNKHHNPGDPIQKEWDFSTDVIEHNLPAEYPEERPDDHSQE